MKERNDIRKELEELSPFLAQLKDKNEGFEVPKNYFNSLTDSIMEQCQVEEVPEATPQAKKGWMNWLDSWLTHLFQPRYVMAFASLLLVVFSFFFLLPTEDSSTEVAFSETISREDAMVYVADNLEDFDLELLAELELDVNARDFIELDEAEVEEYINENVLDDLDETSLEELL